MRAILTCRRSRATFVCCRSTTAPRPSGSSEKLASTSGMSPLAINPLPYDYTYTWFHSSKQQAPISDLRLPKHINKNSYRPTANSVMLHVADKGFNLQQTVQSTAVPNTSFEFTLAPNSWSNILFMFGWIVRPDWIQIAESPVHYTVNTSHGSLHAWCNAWFNPRFEFWLVSLYHKCQPAHVVQWISHSDATCGRAWRARLPLFGGSIRASVR